MRLPAAALLAAFLSAAAGGALAAATTAPASGHVEKTFLVPAEDGYGVGECLTGGKSACGQAVADSWCESQGYASAADYGAAANDDYTGALENVPPPSEKPIRITCQD